MTENNMNARTTIGKVVSNSMTNTIVVLVERKVRHPKYGKFTKKSTKLHAHCTEDVKVGDIVRIKESKPISKKKMWQLVERL